MNSTVQLLPLYFIPVLITGGAASEFCCVCACSYLFWTEWGQYPRIERSRLDGSQRAVLVNVSISWPNGISIDYEVHLNGFFFLLQINV